MFFFLAHLEQNYGGFIAIQDQVKIEPRDQASPYLFGGSYRIPQTTPSPTPSIPNAVSPSPIFIAQSPTPSPYHLQNNMNNNTNNNNNHNGHQNPIESILQNQLQAPRNNGNIFQHQPPTNQIYTPNIPPINSYAVDNNSLWPNNINGTCAPPSTSRNAYNNVPMTSSIFNQPLTPLAPVQNYNNNNIEPKSTFSSLLDLDSQTLLSEQMLNNLSGELKNLSFGDYTMESFSNKHDEKINNEIGRRDK